MRFIKSLAGLYLIAHLGFSGCTGKEESKEPLNLAIERTNYHILTGRKLSHVEKTRKILSDSIYSGRQVSFEYNKKTRSVKFTNIDDSILVRALNEIDAYPDRILNDCEIFDAELRASNINLEPP